MMDPAPKEHTHGHPHIHHETSAWETLAKHQEPYQGYQFPKVSVTVPTYNVAGAVARTLDSIFAQDYPDLDVIVVDAGSQDRTLQIVRNYYGNRVRVYSVTSFNLYEMLNKGVSLAKGQYVNFLCPGFYYVDKDVLKFMMSLALDHDMPHCVFGAALLRDGRSEPKILMRPMTLTSLKSGLQPTSLGAMWFRRDLFYKLGYFPLHYHMRGCLDFVCRFVEHGGLEAVSSSRVIIDQDMRPIQRTAIRIHFWETCQVVFDHFGLWATIMWLMRQRDLRRWLSSWLRSIRVAFSGRGG